MSTYELQIDGSSAEAGANRIVKSFDSIKAAAERMEGGVSAAARKASLSFGNIKGPAISQQAIDSIKGLSSAMQGFRGPSSAATKNTLEFLRGLKSIGSVSISGAGKLGELLTPLANFKGPSSASAKNTAGLLRALSAFSGISGGKGASLVLAELANFKGPSSAAGKNTKSLMDAISNFKAPRGLAAVTTAFQALSAAANQASGSVGKLKSLTSGATTIKVNTRAASSALQGLTRDNNLLQSALLKTQTVFHALGSILAIRAIIDASNAIVKIKAQLQAATGSAEQAAIQFEFLQKYSEKLGLSFEASAKSFGFFLGSVKGTNVTFAEAQKVFVGFSTASRALQLSNEDLDGVFRALGQMMSKGKIQAEELRGQLGDRLPGAFVRFAVALKMTKPGELDNALKKGTITAQQMKDAILSVASALQVEFATSAERMSKTVDSAFNRLKNAFDFKSAELGTKGLNAALIGLADAFTALLKSDAVTTFLTGLGSALQFVAKHAEVFGVILGATAVAATARWVSGLAIATTATNIFGAAMKATAGIQLAASLAPTIGLVGSLGMAFRTLGAILMANPLLWIAATIYAVKKALDYFNSSTEEAKKIQEAYGSTSADTTNLIGAYANQVDISANSLREHTKALEDDTAWKIRNAMAGLQQGTNLGLQNAGKFLGVGYAGGQVKDFRAGHFAVNNQIQEDPEVSRLIAGLVNRKGQARGVNTKADVFNLLSSAGRAESYRRDPLNKGKGDVLKPFIDAANTTVQLARTGNSIKGGAFEGIEADIVKKAGDYNHAKATGAGISGDPVAKAKKAKKDSSGNQDASDLRHAMEQIRDLNREIDTSNQSITQLLSDTSSAIAAQAQGAAKAIVNNIEDSYGSPERAMKGFAQMAANLHIDTSQFTDAKEAVTDYITSLEKAKLQAAKANDVAGEIAGLRLENKARLDTVDAVAVGGREMEKANILMEASQKLVGVDSAQRAILLPQLIAEYQAREDINRAMETANAARTLHSEAALQKNMVPLLGKGYSSDELEYYKALYVERQRLQDAGFDSKQIAYNMELKRSTLDLAKTTKEAMDSEEKLRQLASDQADAVVGAFKQGQEAGDSFLKTMKNIFNDLKNIFLDFVLYNPLKKFLSDTFQSAAGSNGNASALNSQAKNSFGLSGPAGLTSISSLFTSMGPNFTPNQLGSGTSAPKTASEAANKPDIKALSSSYQQASVDGGQTIVNGVKTIFEKRDQNYNIAVNAPERKDPFKDLKATFDWRANGKVFKDFGTSLKSGSLSSISKTIGPAISKGFAALGTYMAVKGFAKSLGLGRVGSEVAGGAAAGFQVGGPLGAAIGAGLGLLKGILTPKPKIPSSFGSVEVGATGSAKVGATGTYGKADATIGKVAAAAGASLFNSFAVQYDGVLRAGKYGTFGQTRVGGKKGTDQSFYTSVGTDRKGRPQGVKGVDWITGTDSQVQAFALVSQIKKGMIQVSDTIKTVALNSKAGTMEGLQSDLAVGEAYDAFNKGSFRMSDLAKQMDSLNESFRKIAKQARALGLDETKLWAARDRIQKGLKDEFNFGVSQGILGIQDPQKAAYNQLVKEYKDTVENAMAVGGDLLAVEKLFGLKRVELTKQTAQDMNNGIVKAAQDMLTQLTATTSSPLNAGTVLANAKDRYKGLQSELNSGNFTNAGDLQSVTQNYLDAAKEVNASSSSFFDIFNEVTGFLRTMSGVAANTTGGTSVVTVPDLPSLDSLVAEIKSNNSDMIAAQNNVGQAVTEVGQATIDQLLRIGYTLDQINTALGKPSSILPATGATGVGDTGGLNDYAGNIGDYYRGGGTGFGGKLIGAY